MLKIRPLLLICVFVCIGACTTTETRVTRQPSEPPAATPTPTRPPLTPISDIDSMYFSRATRYDIVDEHLVALDPNSTRTIEMDALPELIFEWADGLHTVAELLAKLPEQYQDDPPPDLDRNVRLIIRTMERQGLLHLTPAAVNLPSYLLLPASQQDPNVARKEMQRDAVPDRTEPASNKAISPLAPGSP